MSRAPSRRAPSSRPAVPATLALAALLAAAALAAAPRLAALEEGDLKDEQGGTVVHYAIEAPKAAPAGTADPAKQLGLFLCFHEHGGKAADETHSLIESLQRLKLADSHVVIGMQDGTPHGYSPVDDHARAVKLIAWAKKTFPINPRRVYLWGRGEGAKMAGEFGAEHAELVTAVITYSWGFWKLPEAKDPLVDVPDYYVVLGLKDADTHIKTVRETYARVKAHGYRVIYREVEGMGGDTHRPPINDDAVLWATRLRHKTMPLSAEELKLLKPWSTATAGHAIGASIKLFEGLTLVGGPQTGSLMPPIIDAKSDAARILAAQSCALAMFGDQADEALAKRLKDQSAGVRAAAIAALGTAAGWRYPAAQRALAELVGDRKWDAGERALGVDAIAAAVKLQIRGYYQDPPLFKALVDLLDDDHDALRAKSFAVLAPVMASDYQPAADKAARKPTLAKWQEWLDGITAKETTAAPTAAKR